MIQCARVLLSLYKAWDIGWRLQDSEYRIDVHVHNYLKDSEIKPDYPSSFSLN
jgi:hypothetical protein